jgi:hypothetical protein
MNGQWNYYIEMDTMGSLRMIMHPVLQNATLVLFLGQHPVLGLSDWEWFQQDSEVEWSDS